MPRLSTGLRGLDGSYEDAIFQSVFGYDPPAFTATGTASTLPAATASAVPGCPSNADAWQTSQNGYCADQYGWPLRADGSVLTRSDIESSAQNKFIKDNWPYAAGALLFLFWAFGGKR